MSTIICQYLNTLYSENICRSNIYRCIILNNKILNQESSVNNRCYSFSQVQINFLKLFLAMTLKGMKMTTWTIGHLNIDFCISW